MSKDDSRPAGKSGDAAAHAASRGLRWAARCGFVAEGVVYLLIGGLALLAAFEPGRRAPGSKGALAKLAGAPLGDALLALLGAGLAAFVLWQLVQAIFDPAHRRDRWHLKRVAVRLGCLLNAALHGVLVGDAVWRVFGLGAYADNGRAQAHMAALAMQLPFGRWAVAIVGAGIAAFGVFQFYSAATPSRDGGAEPNATKLRGLVIALRVLGFLARGVVFGLIGVFLVHAAWRHDSSYATGIAGALTALQRQPYGSWLLGTVAVGLMAYGIAQIATVRWREIRAG